MIHCRFLALRTSFLPVRIRGRRGVRIGRRRQHGDGLGRGRRSGLGDAGRNARHGRLILLFSVVSSMNEDDDGKDECEQGKAGVEPLNKENENRGRIRAEPETYAIDKIAQINVHIKYGLADDQLHHGLNAERAKHVHRENDRIAIAAHTRQSQSIRVRRSRDEKMMQLTLPQYERSSQRS